MECNHVSDIGAGNIEILFICSIDLQFAFMEYFTWKINTLD